jgi:hypothetical protein
VVSPAVPEFLPGSASLSLLGAVWVWVLALLLGAAVLPPRKDEDCGGRILTWLVVGVVIQTQVWLLLSLLESIRPATVVGVAAALTLAALVPAWRRILRVTRSGIEAARTRGADDGSRLSRTSIVILGAFLLVVARFAFWPTLRYDDLSYHLGLPRQALLTGSWPAMPGLHYSFMPAGWDSAFLLPLSLGGGSGPQLMSVIALALLCWAVHRLARRGGTSAAAAAATILLVVSPMMMSLGAFVGSDLYVGLALTVALERLFATAGGKPLSVGLLTGAAWGAKYTALPAAAGIGLAAAVIRKGPSWKRAATFVLLGLTTVLVPAAWTLRSLLATGNPVYPAFYGVLGGRYWSAESAELVARLVSHGSFEERGIAVFWMALYDLLFRSKLLGLGGINGLFPILGLLGLLLFRKVKGARALILVATVSYLGWCVTSLNLRYALLLLASLAPFAAAAVQWSADRLGRSGRWSRPVLPGVLLLAVAGSFLGGIENHLAFYGKQTTFLDRTPRGEMLASRLNLAAAVAAERLPEDARILLVAEGRLGLLPRPTLASSAYDTPDIVRFMEGVGTVDELNARLSGFTHVVVNYRELERYLDGYDFMAHFSPEEWALFERWLESGLEGATRYGSVAVYRVPAPIREASSTVRPAHPQSQQ